MRGDSGFREVERAMKALAILVSLLALAACQTTPSEPRIVIKTVQVPVPVKCKPTLPPEANYPDTAQSLTANADSPFRVIQLLMAGRVLRIARLQVLNAALQGCEG